MGDRLGVASTPLAETRAVGGAAACVLAGLLVTVDLPWLDTEQDAIARASGTRATVAQGLALAGTPELANLPGRLAAMASRTSARRSHRIFKREFELELWMRRDRQVPPLRRLSHLHLVRRPLGPSWRQGSPAPEGSIQSIGAH